MNLEELLDEVYEKGSNELYAQMNPENGQIQDKETWEKTKADFIAVMTREIRKIKNK